MTSFDGAPDINRMARQLRELERRVDALERVASFPAVSGHVQQIPETSPATARQPLDTSFVSVLGKALLGLAGAYLLRALAESAALPQTALVLIAVAYAGLWLFWSSRTIDDTSHTVYALTAAVIAVPLLWETTVRFHVLPPWATSVLLVLLAAAAAAVAWPRNLAVVTWISTLAAAGTALALMVSTHDLVPFTGAILFIAFIIESAACRNRYLGERWIAAAAADFAVITLALNTMRTGGGASEYASIGIGAIAAMHIGLVGIYLGSTIYRTLVCKLNIRPFEIGQAALVVVIATTGFLRLAGGSAAGRAIVGCVLLCAALACYFVAFVAMRTAERRHTFHAYAAFALALAGAGAWIVYPGTLFAAICAALAVAAMWAGRALDSITLRAHAAIYLSASALAAGLLSYSVGTMVGRLGAPLEIAAVMVAVSAVACYISRVPSISAAAHIPDAIAAAVLWSGLVGFAGNGLSLLGMHSLVPSLRTALLCGVALTLPWLAARTHRRELSWLAYPAMVLGAVKLVVDDLAAGSAATLAFSLLFYGGTLVLLPRMLRTTRVAGAPAVIPVARSRAAAG